MTRGVADSEVIVVVGWLVRVHACTLQIMSCDFFICCRLNVSINSFSHSVVTVLASFQDVALSRAPVRSCTVVCSVVVVVVVVVSLVVEVEAHVVAPLQLATAQMLGNTSLLLRDVHIQLVCQFCSCYNNYGCPIIRSIS